MRIGIAAVLGTVALAGLAAAQNAEFAPRQFQTADFEIAAPQTVLDRQFQVLSKMRRVEVEYSKFGSISRLTGHTGIFS